MYRGLLLLIFFIISTLKLKGQNDVLPVQYFQVPAIVNPALTGQNNFVDLKTGYRHKMVGFDDRPSTFFFNAEGALFPQGKWTDRLRKKIPEWDGRRSTDMSGDLKIGLGAFILRNQQGAFRHFEAGFNSAIHVPITAKSYLALGISPQIVNNSIDLSRITVRDEINDQAYQSLLQNGTSNTFFSINSGLSFHSDKFSIAYGIDRVANALVSGNEDMDRNREMEHHFFGSYNVRLNPKMELIPNAYVSISDAFPTFYDVGLRWRYEQNIWAGLSYRSNDIFIGSLGFSMNSGLNFGYSYQHRSSGLDDLNNGSHEIVLGARLLNGKQSPN